MWGTFRAWLKHFRSDWFALLVSGFVLGWPLRRGTRWLADGDADPEQRLFDYELWADRVATWYNWVIIAGVIVAIVGLVYATMMYSKCEAGEHCRQCADREIERAGQVPMWTS